MIGDKIKLLRTEKKLSQKELADILSISTSAVGMYEQKRRLPDIDIIIKLSKFFDVSTDFLILETNKRNLSVEEKNWIKLFEEIPLNERAECIGFLKGYTLHSKQNPNMHNQENNTSNIKKKEKKHA